MSRGAWYFEAKITDLAEGGATRIGFGQSQANLQGPLGYDKFGYSWRSRYGTAFHVAKGKTFSWRIWDGRRYWPVPDSFKDKVLDV